MATNSYQEQLKATFNQEVMVATDVAYKGLVEGFEKQKLPEPIFKKHFLPYFTGQLQAGAMENVFAQWVGVAGSPNSEVDIIDNAGKTLFTVPALFNTSTIDVNRSHHRGDSIKDIYTEFQRQNSGLPVVAANYFARQMSEKLKDIITGLPPREIDQERWEIIRKFYNIENKQATDTGKNKASNNNDDDLVYEDF